MAKKKKNSYEKKAKVQKALKFLNGDLPSKGNVQTSLGLTAKDVVIGVIGGRLLAAWTKQFSIPVGAVLVGAGYYTNYKFLQVLGVGAMAAKNYKNEEGVKGMDGLEGIKERLKAAKDSLMDDFYINKLLKKNAITNGVGELQYFQYPGGMNGDLAALNAIENQLAESAWEFQGMGEMEDRMY